MLCRREREEEMKIYKRNRETRACNCLFIFRFKNTTEKEREREREGRSFFLFWIFFISVFLLWFRHLSRFTHPRCSEERGNNQRPFWIWGLVCSLIAMSEFFFFSRKFRFFFLFFYIYSQFNPNWIWWTHLFYLFSSFELDILLKRNQITYHLCEICKQTTKYSHSFSYCDGHILS